MLKDLGGNKLLFSTPFGDIVGDYRHNKSNKGIIMLPGFTEDRSVSNYLAKALNTDFKVWNFDLNSQGESTGNWDLEEMIETFKQVHEAVKKNYGLEKLGMHGNSTGGIITGIIASGENCLDAICLTNTPLALQDAFSARSRNWLKRLPDSFIVWGAKLVYKSLQKNHGGELKEEKVKVESDHVKFGSAKIYNIKETVKKIDAAPRLEEYAQNITLPLLFLYGGEDKTSGFKNGEPPQSFKDLFSIIKSVEKKVKVFPKVNHRGYEIPLPAPLPPKYYLYKEDIVDFFKAFLKT